ncbi:phosphotransferase [Streptomyces sp. SYSU K21746]
MRLGQAPVAKGAAALVHGDFRPGDVLIDGDDRRRAVIGGEMATVGDPITDRALMPLHAWLVGSKVALGAGLVPLKEH